MLPDTGERYLTTPLFEGIEAEMNEEEIGAVALDPGLPVPGRLTGRTGGRWMPCATPRTRLPRKRSTRTTGPSVQALSHRIVDDAVALSARRARPPGLAGRCRAEVQAFFATPLPRAPTPLADVYREVTRDGDALPDGQHPSALLVLVHGRRQLHRRARRLPGGRPGLEPRRRQPCRRPAWTSRSSTGARR